MCCSSGKGALASADLMPVTDHHQQCQQRARMLMLQHPLQHRCFMLVSALVVSMVMLQSLPVQANPGASIGIMANCGTSMTITVSCIVALPTQEVLDIRLENADGERSSVCSVPDLPGTAIMVYSLAPGDSIYGVQACYRNGRVVGVTFSSAGGPLVCGNPQAPEAVCRSTSVTEPAPMSAMYGECGRWGLVEITRVCFNPFYINPVIPITACGPGQGRASSQEPCKPCPRNFYNPGGVKGECLRCPSGLVTVTEGASKCGCPPGFGANPNRRIDVDPLCAQCPPGTYYPGGNVEPCWRCRGSAYLTSPPGSASIVQCICRPGYGASATSPNSCQVCPKGTFSDALADSVPQPPLTSLVRIPPGIGNGKGKGGCYTCNPTWKECTPCCEASVRNCTLTTLTPGARSWDACKPVESFFTPSPSPSPSPSPAPAAAELQAEAPAETGVEAHAAAAAAAAGHAFDLPVNTTTASTQAHIAAAGGG